MSVRRIGQDVEELCITDINLSVNEEPVGDEIVIIDDLWV
jgi:hypothetical protein